MTTKTINELTMFKRVKRFILDNTITPPNVELTAETTVLDASITAIEAAAQTQVGGSGEASGGTATQAERARDLREYLKNLSRTARSFDRVAHPGVAEHFKLPRSTAYPRLLASAKAMVEAAAAPVEQLFIQRALPATFLVELGSLITAFETALAENADGRREQVSGTTALKVRAREGLQAATRIDAIVRNHFRNDPVTLAAWRHARHVERLPKRAEAPNALNAPVPTPST